MHASPDTGDVRRIVQGCKLNTLLNGFHNLVVNDYRLEEFFAAMDNAMANSRNLVKGLNHTIGAVGKNCNQLFDGILMGFQNDGLLYAFAVMGLMLDHRTLNTDPVAYALGQDNLICHTDELVLQR